VYSYLLRRILQALVVLMINTVLIFALSRLSADPMAEYNARPGLTADDKIRIAHNLGLDQPIPIQYLSWIGKALQGDMGNSLFSKQPVSKLIIERLPMTLILMAVSEVIILIFSLILGIVAAIKQYSMLDNVITSLSFIGFSLPIFFVGLSLLIIFGVLFKQWGLPFLPTGSDVWDTHNIYEMARHLVLPVTTLAVIQIAGYSRYLRSSILEVLSQDYVRTARAKGVVEKVILFKHVLRNAALPLITILGLDLAAMLGGAVVTESVFSWPGMGRLFWEYAQRGDFPVVNGVLLLTSTAVVGLTIITDVVYTFVDPRIRLS
jgi:peptide/nickel transport system permease protein